MFRRTGARSRSVFSSYGTGRNMESSLATNIQKLFSERIDFFTAVRPAKISVLTSIIKLGLKTLLECVRFVLKFYLLTFNLGGEGRKIIELWMKKYQKKENGFKFKILFFSFLPKYLKIFFRENGNS